MRRGAAFQSQAMESRVFPKRNVRQPDGHPSSNGISYINLDAGLVSLRQVCCQNPGTKINHRELNFPPFKDAVSENASCKNFWATAYLFFCKLLYVHFLLTPLDGMGTGGEPLTRNKIFQNTVAQWKQDTRR